MTTVKRAKPRGSTERVASRTASRANKKLTL